MSASSGRPSAIGDDAIDAVGTARALGAAGCIRRRPTVAVDSGTQASSPAAPVASACPTCSAVTVLTVTAMQRSPTMWCPAVYDDASLLSQGRTDSSAPTVSWIGAAAQAGPAPAWSPVSRSTPADSAATAAHTTSAASRILFRELCTPCRPIATTPLRQVLPTVGRSRRAAFPHSPETRDAAEWQTMLPESQELETVLDAVGPRLRSLRRERGGTLAQLSETTGISVSTLSRL